MGKFMKPGKVVLVLAGRYSGRKAVIVKVSLTSLSNAFASLESGWFQGAGKLGICN